MISCVLYLILGVVILLPAFVAAIARLFWRSCRPDTLALIAAAFILAIDLARDPHRLVALLEPIRDNFSFPSTVGLAALFLIIQLTIMMFIAKLGVAFVDQQRISQQGPPADA